MSGLFLHGMRTQFNEVLESYKPFKELKPKIPMSRYKITKVTYPNIEKFFVYNIDGRHSMLIDIFTDKEEALELVKEREKEDYENTPTKTQDIYETP